MGKQRQSNFELLRIIMICIILIYHFILYNGVLSIPNNPFMVHGLILSSGAVAPIYSFMALSSYFLLNSKETSISRKFKKNFISTAVLLVIKLVIICVVLGYSSEVKFYNDFFVKGSWWYIYIYLIILLLHPLFNKLIYTISIRNLTILCTVLGLWFFINSIIGQVNYFNDFICFVFTYFVIGYLKRTDFNRFMGITNKKYNMLIVYFVCYMLTFCVCHYKMSSDVTHFVIGKYSFQQFIMGIAAFLFFRSLSIPYNQWINKIAENVLYVFLFHETVLAIYWWFGKLRTVDGKLPFENNIEFVGACLLFIGSSFVFGIVVRMVVAKIIRN